LVEVAFDDKNIVENRDSVVKDQILSVSILYLFRQAPSRRGMGLAAYKNARCFQVERRMSYLRRGEAPKFM